MSKKKYIEFKLLEKKPKTSIYSVVNLKSKTSLGTIEWYGAWRQYCFFPIPHTVFNKDCLDDIKEFIQNLMDKRMLIKS